MGQKNLWVAALGMALTLTACAQQEEEVVVEQTPIYAKDGTVIGSEPFVVPDPAISGASGIQQSGTQNTGFDTSGGSGVPTTPTTPTDPDAGDVKDGFGQ